LDHQDHQESPEELSLSLSLCLDHQGHQGHQDRQLLR
jgi:hypothetical protein